MWKKLQDEISVCSVNFRRGEGNLLGTSGVYGHDTDSCEKGC